MGIASEIWDIYRRAAAFARAMPAIAAIPFVIELARQLLLVTGAMTRPITHGFSVLGTVGLVCVMVPALRWWRFEDDRSRVWRLRWNVLWGVVAMLAIQLTDELLFTTAGHLVAGMTGAPRTPIVFVSQLMWLFVSVLLYGWYVAMLTDDPVGLRAVVAVIRPKWLTGFAIVVGSLVPILALTLAARIAGGKGLIGYAPSILIGSTLSAAIIIVTSSAYFAIYRLARTPG